MSKAAITALVIDPDGTVTLGPITPTLDGIKAALGGGWLEPITPSTGRFGSWTGYVDEDGKIKGLPYNPVATEFAHRLTWAGLTFGDFLVGPLVIVGGPDRDGNDTDLPPEVIEAALRVGLDLDTPTTTTERHTS